MTIEDGSLSLPYDLRDLTGIAKNRILDLRRRVILGLTLSDDEPIKATFSKKVIDWQQFLERDLHPLAQRTLGRDKAPAEARWR